MLREDIIFVQLPYFIVHAFLVGIAESYLADSLYPSRPWGHAQKFPRWIFRSFFDDSSLAVRQSVAEELAKACHANGCVGIVGHGIPHEVLQESFAMARKLFDLPMDQKMQAPHPKGAVPHRGCSAPGKEKAYTKEDLRQDEHHREALRKIVDCKVRKASPSSITSFEC